jgi:amidase
LQKLVTRRLLIYVLVAVGLAVPIAAAPAASRAHHPPVLDLESLTGPEAEAMMAAGELTSVELTRAYLERIEALNKRGPGLNAVTQINPHVLKEAALSDKRRDAGQLLGPADGLPILLKT